MNTKTCKKCGWVYPLITPYTSCRFCGMAFTVGTCRICGEYTDDLIPGRGMCRKCHNKQDAIYKKRSTFIHTKAFYARRLRQREQDKYADWLSKLSRLTTHPLTEAEWLEACTFFDGCALCGSENIDTRYYFVQFEEGGKYTACNILPVCERCATTGIVQVNPFIRLNPRRNYQLKGTDRTYERYERAVGYLQSKLEEAQNEQERQDGSV